jgi:hypothetical protein
MNLDEVNKLWYDFQPIKGIAFGLNDSVRIKSGDYAGQIGSVISIISVEQMPIYLIELGKIGLDVQIKQSELEPDYKVSKTPLFETNKQLLKTSHKSCLFETR